MTSIASFAKKRGREVKITRKIFCNMLIFM